MRRVYRTTSQNDETKLSAPIAPTNKSCTGAAEPVFSWKPMSDGGPVNTTVMLLPIIMKYLFFTLLIFTVACLGCKDSAGSQFVSISQTKPSPSPIPDQEYPKQLDDIFVDDDSLSYNGYNVIRRKKKVKLEYPDEKGKTISNLIEVSFAVVQRKNRTLAKFEGVYFGAGNATDFGLFPLLGERGPKQLVVSQTIPRGGRHWVASMSPNFQLLFDSGDYGVGREDFSVIDIDKDGIYEILLPVTTFYSMQDKMYIAEIPLPKIIFKYDPQAKKYFPANSLFQDYVLRGIESDITTLNKSEGRNYLSKRLNIFLRYIYAEKESDAWAFFDREYRLLDREEIKSRIRAILKDESVYKYIHRKRAT
jgi:hypothetical protein